MLNAKQITNTTDTQDRRRQRIFSTAMQVVDADSKAFVPPRIPNFPNLQLKIVLSGYQKLDVMWSRRSYYTNQSCAPGSEHTGDTR
ncbi:unnamed protein product [Colias eurytheme]|nr:unnamed protein product [Colias eurytheme]